MNSIRENLASIQRRISAAALRCGRRPEEIRLVAVSKKMGLEKIKEAMACGQLLFGENYMQEAVVKINHLGPASPAAGWHFIGHLQSNKAKIAADHFQVIETVDRFKLATVLENHLAVSGRELTILIQVNTGRELQKSGVLPEDCAELLRRIATSCRHLKVAGLMTMPPAAENPEATRPYFRLLKQLAADLQAQGLLAGRDRPELSMGMSDDFEVAIEEGATLVRVGTAIFGHRV